MSDPQWVSPQPSSLSVSLLHPPAALSHPESSHPPSPLPELDLTVVCFLADKRDCEEVALLLSDGWLNLAPDFYK